MTDGELEFLVLGTRFRTVADEWDLSRRQVATLLGVDEEAPGLDLVPLTVTVDAETRMRLVADIRDLLPALLPDPREAPLWVRGAFGGTDDDPPFTFMAGGVANMRALRMALLSLGGGR